MSSLSAQIWMGFRFAFALSWTTISDKNTNFENFGQNMLFKQNSKISGTPALHLFILAVVVSIIER